MLKDNCFYNFLILNTSSPPWQTQNLIINLISFRVLRFLFSFIVRLFCFQKTPKLISSNNGRVVKLPQKSPKKSPFHQSHAEKKTKSPKVANNGAQGKRVRPRNKHDEDWGVDLRNDGFQVCFALKY